MANEMEQTQANNTQTIGGNCKNASVEKRPDLGSIITLI